MQKPIKLAEASSSDDDIKLAQANLSENACTVWEVLLAGLALAFSGCVPPAAGILVTGRYSRYPVESLLSAITTEPNRIIQTFNSTPAALETYGNETHHSVFVVDNLRAPAFSMSKNRCAAVVEALVSRSYQAPGTRPPGKHSDYCTPLMIFAANRPVDWLLESARERLLVVEMRDLVSSDDNTLYRIGVDGAFRRVFSRFVRWLAGRIDAESHGKPYSAPESWQARLNREREKIAASLPYSGNSTSVRRNLVAGLQLGWDLWSSFCAEAASLNASAAARLRDGGLLRIAAARSSTLPSR